MLSCNLISNIINTDSVWEEHYTTDWPGGCLSNCTSTFSSPAEADGGVWRLTSILSGSKLEEERQRRMGPGRHLLTGMPQQHMWFC